MASKFQNRLVGTIILVALGVIVLPGLLDGQKKHYQDEFAAIPLVPKPGDSNEPDMLLSATQALPAQPPEGAAEEVRAGASIPPGLNNGAIPNEGSAGVDEVSVLREQPKRQQAQDKPKSKAVEKPQAKPAAVDNTGQSLDMASGQPSKVEKTADKAPTGQAYVVQLGALKNADKVNEIVAKLRGAGFKVYTSPTAPVQGKITRILVGPDTSKDKLKASLGQLNSLSGLNGVVMNYSPR